MGDVTGFVKAAGRKLVNGEGREILLRGVGLGGWLLPEGYMWCLSGQGDRPRRIEKMIEELIGEEKSKQFWKKYFDRFITEADVRQIAAEGFNSVRVPINSRHLLSESEPVCLHKSYLHLIDRVIGWCRKHGLYVILDLHGAPGGQTGTNIDDSENDQPELFIKEQNRYATIELWRMLAQRYRDEWIVAGYDLLNEPLPDWFSKYNKQVMPLYKDIVEAIRQVDKKHMIILEGVHWATDWSVFNEKIDDNLMLQFHKYWSNPDTESIQPYLDKGEVWNVPIFMGEGGENNKEWLTGAFRLYEDHNISWNFWTWKKMNRNNSPYSIKKPEGWEKLASFPDGGDKPDQAVAEHILEEFLNNLPMHKCEYHPEIVNALFHRPPILIPAVFYGYRGKGTDFEVHHAKGTSVEFRKNDGPDIKFIEDIRSQPNFKHMAGEPWEPEEWMFIRLDDQDWVSYPVNVDTKSEYFLFTIKLCVNASDGHGQISISVDGVQACTIDVKKGSWRIICLKDELRLGTGLHKIVIKAMEKSVDIKWIEINPSE